jgi:DNA polymerase kappa
MAGFSLGIGPNRQLAKICVDVNKPNGQFRLQPDREAIVAFLKDLPVRKISGVGKVTPFLSHHWGRGALVSLLFQVTEQMLKGLGITKCSEIQDKRAVLFRLFKPSSAEFFLRASLGIWSPTSGEDSR